RGPPPRAAVDPAGRRRLVLRRRPAHALRPRGEGRRSRRPHRRGAVRPLEGDRMTTIDGGAVHKLVVACDAGMGSSAMLAGTLRKQLKKSGVEVIHSPVAEIPKDADVVVTHNGLAERARGVVPDVPVVPFNLFL